MMTPVLTALFVSLSISGIEGPIDEICEYARVQEEYLKDVGSYTATIRQVRDSFGVHLRDGGHATNISEETLSERTIIGGGRFVERTTERRSYSEKGTEAGRSTFSYLLLEDLAAMVLKEQGVNPINVVKFTKGERLPRDAERIKNLMNPRDLLVHGFGDGLHSLQGLCDQLKVLAAETNIQITKMTVNEGRVRYSFLREGVRFQSVELDPSRMGMVTAVQFFEAANGGRLGLEVRVDLGKLLDGRPFPAVWHHLTYGYDSEGDRIGRVQTITRNELLEIEINSVDQEEVTFLAFGLPDGTLAAIKHGEAQEFSTGYIDKGFLVEGQRP